MIHVSMTDHRIGYDWPIASFYLGMLAPGRDICARRSRSDIVPDYRLYRLDPHSGHIRGAEDMHAGDDVAAIHDVQLRRIPVPVELWQGKRKVTRIDATPEAAAYARPPGVRSLSWR
jgi:hypothetical protein